MSRARKEQLAAAQGGKQVWRVVLTRTLETGRPPVLDVQCGGHPVAETILMIRNAADLLEKQKAAPESCMDVHGCARCGKDHARIHFKPIDNAGPDCTHYGTCPATGQPILMCYVPKAAAPEEGGNGAQGAQPGHA